MDEVSVVAGASARQCQVPWVSAESGEGPSGSQEYAGSDVRPAGPERVADHVDWFDADVLDVPFGVHVEFEPVVREGGDASCRDRQVAFRASEQQDVVHVEEDVGDEPSLRGGAVPVPSGFGESVLAEVPDGRQVIIRQVLAEVAADVQAVIAGVGVDEVEDEAQERHVADVVREHRLERRPINRWIAFAHIEFDEDFARWFADPFADGTSCVVGAAVRDARGLPSSYLRVEQGHEGDDRDVVDDLLFDGLTADDAMLAGNRFDTVEVSDTWMVESAGPDLAGESDGEVVEVRVVFQESRDVAS